MRVLLASILAVAQANDLSWNVNPLSDPVSVTFEEGSTEELRLHYSVTSDRDYGVTLFDSTCTTEFTDTMVASASYEIISESDVSGEDFFDAVVDIGVDSVTSSSLWSQEGNVATIGICVRVDLYSGDISVSFHETSLQLDIDLAVGFSSASVALNREGAEQVDTDAEVTFSVDACQCVGANVQDTDVCTTPSAGIYGGDGTDQSFAGSEAPALVQNSILDLCISTSSPEVNIVEIQSLSLDQTDGLSRTPITDSNADVLTAINAVGEHINVISTRLVSGFFDSSSPESIVASGTVLLEFAGSRRQLANIRILQTGTQDSPFETKVELTKTTTTVSDRSGAAARLLSLGAIFAALLLSLN